MNHVSSLDILPLELLDVVESFLAPSTISKFAATNHFFCDRWNSDRWEDHYNEQRGRRRRSNKRNNFSPTFNTNLMKYNVFALYNEMWKNLELLLLGFHDYSHSRPYANTRTMTVKSFFLCLAGMKPLLHSNLLGRSSRPSEGGPFSRFPKTAQSIPPYKIASILAENNIDTLHCRICNLMDVDEVTTSFQSKTWIKPCNCSYYHRKCIEPPLSPTSRSWCSYDDPARLIEPQHVGSCPHCKMNFRPDLRLPSGVELLKISLHDRNAWLRLFSVFVHFALSVILIGALQEIWCRGVQEIDGGLGGSDGVWKKGCEDCLEFEVFSVLKFRWPKQGKWELLWWQMQQCTTLHIFFSARFSVIVDGLWLGRNFNFYAHMYTYFIVASGLLFVTYTIGAPFYLFYSAGLEPILGALKNSYLPIINFTVYFFISHAVIIIFWKTNYRVRTLRDVRTITEDDRHAILAFPRAT